MNRHGSYQQKSRWTANTFISYPKEYQTTRFCVVDLIPRTHRPHNVNLTLFLLNFLLHVFISCMERTHAVVCLWKTGDKLQDCSLPLCGPQGSNSDHQVQQKRFPAETFWRPLISGLESCFSVPLLWRKKRASAPMKVIWNFPAQQIFFFTYLQHHLLCEREMVDIYFVYRITMQYCAIDCVAQMTLALTFQLIFKS